jgi:hypothetical protein
MVCFDVILIISPPRADVSRADNLKHRKLASTTTSVVTNKTSSTHTTSKDTRAVSTTTSSTERSTKNAHSVKSAPINANITHPEPRPDDELTTRLVDDIDDYFI